MSIPNSSFEDFAIEFKEINSSDFPEFILNDKIIITPNETTGYIHDVLQSNIQLEQKNTVVINAAVGQGKTYAIIQTIKRYYNEMQNGGQNYLIIVASPFVSLVKQYCDDIHKDAEIPEDKIYNYGNIGRSDETYLDKPIQVVTANTLLGNPGEDAFKNSDAKRTYINELIGYCKSTNTKAIFIYDEIHDSYHNFKEEYIFNLWKWRDVIHKNFILSATYNEASKIVIEYLAELTDKKIKIIESKRVRFSEKQSSLHLHYSPTYRYNNNTPEIVDLIKKLISKRKNIDILCYSKTLAKSLIDSKEEIGKLLKDTFVDVKDCTSELIVNQRTKNHTPKNQYDNTKCNVGTNFKTGVSIKKENHAFIIIMPPRSTKLGFKNQYGIFSGGINSIIQALARQRKKGEIHIILPRPNAFNYESLRHSHMTEVQKAEFQNLYSILGYNVDDKLVSYSQLNNQDLLIRKFYNDELRENVKEEIQHIDNIEREHMLQLKFPSYEQFKLNHGENYIANNYPFFGEDISSYMTYGALTNQFVNCKLKEINIKSTLYFTNGQIQQDLNYYYNQYFGEDHFYFYKEWTNFSFYYHEVRNTLFNEFELKYRRDTEAHYQNIIPYSGRTKEFEIQLLQFIAIMYYGKQYEYNLDTDQSYNRSTYFLDNIKLCTVDHVTHSSTESINKKRFFTLLNHFKSKITDSIQEYKSDHLHFYYVPTKPSTTFFTEDDISKFEELENLIQYDKLLANNIFKFKSRLQNKPLDKKLDSFYSMLCEDFLVFNRSKIPIGDRSSIYKITALKTLPQSINVINLITPQDYNNLENRIQAEIAHAGGEENYYYRLQEEINNILD
ncbi:hypothetical protein UJ101_02046 [Flavobacteriaceae bacterium UJ101]|nr:hypothetical protein UJ101_02046 [Flavobacteriaceae bacterium UJ101]